VRPAAEARALIEAPTPIEAPEAVVAREAVDASDTAIADLATFAGPAIEPSVWPAANAGDRPAGGPDARESPAAGDGPLVAGLLDGADPWAGARSGLLVLGLVSLIAAVVLAAVIVFR